MNLSCPALYASAGVPVKKLVVDGIGVLLAGFSALQIGINIPRSFLQNERPRRKRRGIRPEGIQPATFVAVSSNQQTGLIHLSA